MSVTARDITHNADLYRAAYPWFGAPGPDTVPRSEPAPQVPFGADERQAEAEAEAEAGG
jgi:hypothetical protein